MLFNDCSFETADHSDQLSKKWVEVSSNSKLYSLLLKHIAEHGEAKSFAAEVLDGSQSRRSGKGCAKGKACRIALNIGLGTTTFKDFEGNSYVVVHQTKGKPVGTECSVAELKNLVIFTDGCMETLTSFLSRLVELSEVTEKGIISIFSFNSRCSYWRSSGSTKARPLDSVILPAKTKEHIVSDISNFLSKEMRDFYQRHGIPYRRSYLFYGVPGAGKTSLIQALAGHFERSISYLQVDPTMTDVSLRTAMQSLPRDTVVVLEDVDALFGKDRASMRSDSHVSFSGLLNALDGVGSASGQIYILTTNLRDQLDPALIRKGRVDMQVRFDAACDEQAEQMWASFYPAAAADAPGFRGALRAALAGREVSTAELQHFFVVNMRSPAAEALGRVGEVAEELREREASREAEEAAKSAAKDAAKEAPQKGRAAAQPGKAGGKPASGLGNAAARSGRPGGEEEGSSSSEEASEAGSGDGQHVHLHVHVSAGKVQVAGSKRGGAAGGAREVQSEEEEE